MEHFPVDGKHDETSKIIPFQYLDITPEEKYDRFLQRIQNDGRFEHHPRQGKYIFCMQRKLYQKINETADIVSTSQHWDCSKLINDLIEILGEDYQYLRLLVPSHLKSRGIIEFADPKFVGIKLYLRFSFPRNSECSRLDVTIKIADECENSHCCLSS